METAPQTRIIEINGAKFEIDLRTAKQITQFRVGDRVKVLVKSYGTKYDSFPGVIVAIDAFNNLPSVTVCYIGDDYNGTLKFATINSQTTETEIAPCTDDIQVSKADVISRIDREIIKLEAQIEDLNAKKNYFTTKFQTYFEQP
jgi:hypothetical protein